MYYAQDKGYVRLITTEKPTWDAMKTCQNNADPIRFTTTTSLRGWAPLVGSAKLRIYISKYIQTGLKKPHYRRGYKAHGRLQSIMRNATRH